MFLKSLGSSSSRMLQKQPNLPAQFDYAQKRPNNPTPSVHLPIVGIMTLYR